MTRAILLALLLVLPAGCTVPATRPADGATAPAMRRHRLLLPDGHWPVLVQRIDPAAHTMDVELVTLTGPSGARITGVDPAVRTMTVAAAGTRGLAALAARPARGPCLLTVVRGQVTAVYQIARPRPVG